VDKTFVTMIFPSSVHVRNLPIPHVYIHKFIYFSMYYGIKRVRNLVENSGTTLPRLVYPGLRLILIPGGAFAAMRPETHMTGALLRLGVNFMTTHP